MTTILRLFTFLLFITSYVEAAVRPISLEWFQESQIPGVGRILSEKAQEAVVSVGADGKALVLVGTSENNKPFAIPVQVTKDFPEFGRSVAITFADTGDLSGEKLFDLLSKTMEAVVHGLKLDQRRENSGPAESFGNGVFNLTRDPRSNTWRLSMHRGRGESINVARLLSGLTTSNSGRDAEKPLPSLLVDDGAESIETWKKWFPADAASKVDAVAIRTLPDAAVLQNEIEIIGSSGRLVETLRGLKAEIPAQQTPVWRGLTAKQVFPWTMGFGSEALAGRVGYTVVELPNDSEFYDEYGYIKGPYRESLFTNGVHSPLAATQSAASLVLLDEGLSSVPVFRLVQRLFEPVGVDSIAGGSFRKVGSPFQYIDYNRDRALILANRFLYENKPSTFLFIAVQTARAIPENADLGTFEKHQLAFLPLGIAPQEIVAALYVKTKPQFDSTVEYYGRDGWRHGHLSLGNSAVPGHCLFGLFSGEFPGHQLAESYIHRMIRLR